MSQPSGNSTAANDPSIPEGVRVYAIGDIHGRIDLLQNIFRQIDDDRQTYPVQRPIEVYVGDYVDRGPNSSQVIEALINRKQRQETICLRGNHEAILQQFLERPETLSQWRQLGGLETLLSYGLRAPLKPTRADELKIAEALRRAMPQSHQAWLVQLQDSFTIGDYFFAHAGVRPNVPLAYQASRDLHWIREEFLDWPGYFEKIIVHGHTPVEKPTFRHNRINIDTGAYATNRLTCVILESDKTFLL